MFMQAFCNTCSDSHMEKTDTLNHTAPFPLFPQTGLGDTQAWSFSIQYSQSNYNKRDSHITRRFLLVWQSLNHFLPHQPTATNSMHLHSTHTPLLLYLWSDSHLKSDQRSVVEFFVEKVNMFRSLAVYAEELFSPTQKITIPMKVSVS